MAHLPPDPASQEGRRQNVQKLQGDLLVVYFVQNTGEHHPPESQAGFRAARGCIDQIYSLHQILEQRHEFRRATVICFVDLTAAFDSIHRLALWRLLREADVTANTDIIVNMYLHTSCKIKAYNDESDSFFVFTGVRQDGTLSPVLFLLAVNHILKTVESRCDLAIRVYN